jgi:hypothetical protein
MRLGGGIGPRDNGIVRRPQQLPRQGGCLARRHQGDEKKTEEHDFLKQAGAVSLAP